MMDPLQLAEIERQLLGHCMGPVPGVFDSIDWTKIVITDPICAAVQRILASITDSPDGPLIFEVEDELAKTNLDTDDADLWQWASKIDATGTETAHYVKILQQATLGRKIRAIMRHGLNSDLVGDDLHSEITDYMLGMESVTAGDTVGMKEATLEWTKYIESLGKNDTAMTTGYKTFDDWGLIGDGSVMTIAGRPSMGKSAFVLWLAIAWARRGERVFWLSSETSLMKLLTRIGAQLSNFNSAHINGDISRETWGDIASAAHSMADLPIRINDTADRQPEIVSEIRKQKTQFKPTIVIVDHIQECIDNEEPRLETNKLISALRSSCRHEPKAALVMVSQLSRKVEQRTLRIPSMSDLKESGKIEEASDSILFVTRPHYYRHQVDEYKDADSTLMLVDVAKNRDGKTGRMKFVWNNDKGQVVGPRKEDD